MSVARVAARLQLGGALAVAALACGERAGDAVVALPAAEDPAQGGDGGTSGDDALDGVAAAATGSAGGTRPSDVPTAGPGGLCAPCVSSSECGDANDACIVRAGARFCGRDCEEPRDCPDGYACVELGSSQLWQCVPNDSCRAPEEAAPSLSDVRRYVLTRINVERLAASRPPLDSSDCLDQVAQQSAVEFARTDEPLGKYVKECDPIWPNCACGWWAEAEVTVARYGLDWETAIDAALSASRDGGSTRFAQAYLSSAVSDVGIGFWLSGDEAWVALSFR